MTELSSTSGRPWTRRIVRTLGWAARFAATAAASYLGGVAATNLAPTTVDVSHYRAVLRLDPVPKRVPDLHLPTIAGDINLSFRAPLLAPGLDVSVSVTEDITNLVEANNISVAGLEPSTTQINQAISDAARGVTTRFAVGALVVAGGIVLAAGGRRGLMSARGRNATVATAVVTAIGLTGAGIASTYRPERFREFTASGVVGLLVKNTSLLRDVSSRSNQVTPYVRNLLAMSAALQSTFVPPGLDGSAGPRLLLVSDLHGSNMYPFMKQIIEQENIDAVIDAGDIVNLGHPEELTATRMQEGIASLGVPYIVVTGNHDNASPTDTKVLTALSKIPNVELLQTPNGDFREVTIMGLRIAGLNDTRWMGDPDVGYDELLRPNLVAFNEAWRGQPDPDVVVMHEPYLLGELEHGRLTINGHMHTPGLTGNHIQVGTFTGGGILSHFRPAEEGAELIGQPYSFDIATFGSGCALTQLTRFTYRDLLEGHPRYDRVQVINGDTIDPLAAQAHPPTPSSPDAAQPAPAAADVERSCTSRTLDATRTLGRFSSGE